MPVAPPAVVPQDRSTPVDSQAAYLADEANRRLAAGEDPAAIEADMAGQAQSSLPGYKPVRAPTAKASKSSTPDWDSLSDAPPRASELTSAYQPLESYQGQVYNSPSAALAQPDAFAETGSQVQGVGDYLANLGTESAEKLRSAAAGVVQGVGEIPQMARDLAAKVGTFSGVVQGGVPPSAVFTAAAQAQGAPADNALASAGQFEAQKAAKAQEQAAARLVPAPDEDTSGLDQAAYYTQQAVAGAPLVAGAMAAGPAGGAALFGASTAGEQYAAKRAAGEAPVSAAASSGIEGAVSALTASLSLESALNPGAIGALRRIAETTGSVEAQSVINEATSIAAEQSIDGKDISADEIQARLIGAAKGGIPAGVLMGGVGAATHGGDAADTAAANVRRLAENIAPPEARPTLEERVNAREIPQDQGILPGAGAVQEGSGETGGENVQRTAAAGNAPGDAGEQVDRGAENVDQNVQPTDAERAAQTAAQAEVPQGAQAPPIEEAANATASVAPAPEVLRTAPLYARAETAGVDDAREVADAAKAWKQQGTRSPYFQRYFQDSKVVDADGEPLVVHHGTGEDFAAFNPDAAGDTTGHMTAPLGHFFAVDRGSAERYAEKAANGVPADQRVIDAYLSIKNPKTMSLDDFMAIDSQDDARALKAKLQQQGYDGIHLTDAGKGQWIAFDPAQIKDVGNRGTFDTADARMKYAQREGSPTTDNLTHEQAREALTKEFGATAMRKLEANGLNLVPRGELAQHAPELSQAQRAGVKGFTPPDRSSANVVHDNVTRAELPETVIHEVVHANLDRILPEATRNALASAIQARGRTSPEVRAALDAIPKTTPKASMREEVLAQTMGNLYTQPIGRRVVDAFKLGLNRMGVPMDWLGAHEAAIRQIGIENLRHYAEAPRRAPVTTLQMAPRAAPAVAGQPSAEKPRIRVPVDKVPVERVIEPPEAPVTSVPKTEIPENRVSENRIRPTTPEDAVGISRRTVDPEQAAQGNAPLQAQGKRDFGSAWDAATQKRIENPDAGKNLVADLLTDPRPLTAEDTALLTQQKAEIANRYDAAVKAQNDAREAGDRRGEVAAGVQRKMIEAERALFNQAAVNSGYEASLSLSIRRMMSDRDYSMVGQMAALKAIEKGGDIPDAVRKQMERYVTEHQAANDAFMKSAAADEAKAKPTRTPPLARKSLDDDFNRMAQELKRISAKPEAKTAYARVEDPAMADLIRKMARNRSDAGETDPQAVLSAIHDAIGGAVPRQDISNTITSRGTGRRHTLSELQARYNALQRELRGNPKDRARQTALQKELAKIKSQIQRKEYDPEKVTRVKPQYSEPTLALEREVKEARRRIEGLRAQRERANMSVLGKSVDLITNMQMMDILLGWPVFKKLVGSVIATHVSTPLTEIGVSAAKALNPALRKYAAEAPRWGSGFKPGSLKATYGFDPRFQSASGGVLKAAFDRLLKGVTESQKQYGDHAMTHEYTDFMGNLADAWATKNGWEMARTVSGFPGRSHGLVKEFSSTPEERRGMYYRTLQMREKLAAQGWTPEQIDAYVSKRSSQAMIGAGGYADGLRSKYQEDNRFNDWVNRQIGASYRYGAAGHIARAAFKIEEPVRQIAMNIVNRISSYSFGGIGAAAKMRQFKDMTPEQFAKSITPDTADYIMRNVGRQMVGVPMLTLAFLGGKSIFGGLWSKDNKDKELQPGEVNLSGTHLAAQWAHDPFAQLLHIGTSLRDTFDSYYSKEQPGYYTKLEAFAKALAGTYADVAKEDVPYISGPLRDVDTYEKAEKFRHRGGSELIGSKLRSIVIPQELQRQAKEQTGGYPQPRNWGEDLAVGIPDFGLGIPVKSVRDVPQKGNRKYKSQ